MVHDFTESGGATLARAPGGCTGRTDGRCGARLPVMSLRRTGPGAASEWPPLARCTHHERPIARGREPGRVHAALELGPALGVPLEQCFEQANVRLARVEARHLVECRTT